MGLGEVRIDSSSVRETSLVIHQTADLAVNSFHQKRSNCGLPKRRKAEGDQDTVLYYEDLFRTPLPQEDVS